MIQRFEAGYGENYEKPVKHINHADLQPASDESDFKSQCPECKTGILLMRRKFMTSAIENIDSCIVCAQQFIYDDVTGSNWIPTKREVK